MQTIVQFLDHGDDAARDFLGFLEAKRTLTASERNAYRAGFRAGWNAARAEIALHGQPKEGRDQP